MPHLTCRAVLATAWSITTTNAAAALPAAIIALCLGSAVVAKAASLAVDCEGGAKVAATIMQARPGDEIVVSGTCRESVLIPSPVHDVTLRGQNNAAIIGPDPKRPVVLILGREIRVSSLRLAQGRNGISVLRGATAQVDGVIIEDAGRERIPGSGLGMNIGQHAFASVTNSTIRNNWNIGILVHENSGARIGFVDVATITGANTIVGNGTGILVSGAAQARVVATTIAHNRSDGIRVEGGSHLESPATRSRAMAATVSS